MYRPMVLMYHLVDDLTDPKISVSADQLRAHLVYLRDSGYRSLSIDAYIRAISGAEELSHKAVLITFDDGYSDVIERAVPLLQIVNFTATVFLITGYMGNMNWWNRKACYLKRHMTWEQARELVTAGWDLGAHTMEHHCLVKLDAEQIEDELVSSKEAIEQHCGVAVRTLSYPYGDFNGTVEDLASRHFDIAFSVNQGSFDSAARPYGINRLEVSRRWTVDVLDKALHGGQTTT